MARLNILSDPGFAEYLDENCSNCTQRTDIWANQEQLAGLFGRAMIISYSQEAGFRPSDDIEAGVLVTMYRKCLGCSRKIPERIIDTDSCLWREVESEG